MGLTAAVAKETTGNGLEDVAVGVAAAATAAAADGCAGVSFVCFRLVGGAAGRKSSS